MSKESRSTEKMRYKSKIFWSKWFHHSLLSGFSITLMPSRTNAFTMGSVTQILQASSLSSTGWQSLDLELLWLVSMPIQRPGICGHVQWCHVVSEGLVPTVCTRATIPRKTNIIRIRLMMVYIFATYVCFMFVLLKRTTEQKLAVPMNFCESESQSHSQSATVDVYKEKDVFWNVSTVQHSHE